MARFSGPSGPALCITVTYNNATESFSSGTTGDTSEIILNFDVGTADVPNLNDISANFLGFAVTAEEPALAARLRMLRYVVWRQHLRQRTAPLGINVDNVFAVTETNNRFNVTVDGERHCGAAGRCELHYGIIHR